MFLPQATLAQIDAPEGIPSIDEQQPEGYADAQEYKPQTFVRILGQIRDFLLIAGVVFIVVMLIISGITYIQAKGSGDQDKLTKAKKRISWTLIGAAVIMAIYILISTLRNIIAGQSLV
jgi:cytochrome bd-type quinol oxidase subunit 2